MSVITPTTYHPSVSPDATNVPSGLASTFRGNLNTYVAAVEDKAQLTQALLEAQNLATGNGCISGGTVAAGAGLNVTVTAIEAIVGTHVKTDATITVGIGDSTATTYNVYLRQSKAASGDADSTLFTVRKVSDGVPTDISAKGQYLFLSVITSNGASVTAVDSSARVTWTPVADGTITTAKLAAGAVTAAKITAATITGTEIASGIALAGNPTTTTQSAGNSTTRIATTAFVQGEFTARSYAANVGDGSSTSIAVTHSLGTRDVIVEVYRNSGNYDTILVEVQRTSTSQITLVFDVAPASNEFRVIVTKAG